MHLPSRLRACFQPPASLRPPNSVRLCLCPKSPVWRQTTCASCAPPSRLDLTPAKTPISSQAVDALRSLYTQSNATVHRGKCAHYLGRVATSLLADARQDAARFLRAGDAGRVVFSPCGLTALQTVVGAIAASLQPRDEVLLPVNLYDDALRVSAGACARYALVPRMVRVNLEGGDVLDVEHFAMEVGAHTRLAVIPAVCPVTGVEVAVRPMCEFLRAVGTAIVIDARSCRGWSGWRIVRRAVEAAVADFVVVDCGHLGAPGRGAVVVAKDVRSWERLPPVGGGDGTVHDHAFQMEGGEGMRVDDVLDVTVRPELWAPVPDRFEDGVATMGVAVACGAAFRDFAGSDDVEGEGDGEEEEGAGEVDEVERRASLVGRLDEQLSFCDGVVTYVSEESRLDERTVFPVACFNVDDHEPHRVATLLEERGVEVESGDLGCGVALRDGVGVDSVVRVVFDETRHSVDDVDRFVDILEEVVAVVDHPVVLESVNVG